MRKHPYDFLVALTILAALASRASAEFAVDWWTIDGGGAMWTVGGNYELSGTIGQPDAGVAMTGGTFALVGGFWAGAASTAPPLCPGDLNCDGVVNFDDIDPFVVALGCQGGDPNCWDPTCPWLNGDCNDDQTLNFDDIDPFVGLIGSACP